MTKKNEKKSKKEADLFHISIKASENDNPKPDPKKKDKK
jgi:hypothetical protein